MTSISEFAELLRAKRLDRSSPSRRGNFSTVDKLPSNDPARMTAAGIVRAAAKARGAIVDPIDEPAPGTMAAEILRCGRVRRGEHD